ncbi:hypothetical protein M569_17611 [Genlisea aurea]|uniref:Reverse transcriptase domain-containing protein n=1 Tax=Genlisea aurea TaxID=192259 RepID=S8BS11_9LAMI|nr:hypothetical protein M569_17611 [Genlisea aurea]
MTRERKTKPRSSLTEASKEGVKILRALIDILREREETEYKATGVRKWWTVESIEEVALNVKANEDKLIGLKMRTADFTTMYTKLPHQKIIDAIVVAWDRAVEYKRRESKQHAHEKELGFVIDQEGEYHFQVIDRDNTNDSPNLITRSTFLELMTVLITDNHIWNGGDLKRQVIGIPMGSPVSPHFANLFRYAVEAKFVEELLASGKLKEAQACAHTYAYIDDLCTFGGPLPSEQHYGIPMTGDPEPREEEWDFNVIKYPHASSNIPWNQGAAVFKGQLIRTTDTKRTSA